MKSVSMKLKINRTFHKNPLDANNFLNMKLDLRGPVALNVALNSPLLHLGYEVALKFKMNLKRLELGTSKRVFLPHVLSSCSKIYVAPNLST